MSRRLPFAVGLSICVTALMAAACATPTTPTADRVAPAEVPASWLCSRSPSLVRLAELGVPASSRAVDVALGPDDVTVLLQPARLVILPRRLDSSEGHVVVGAPNDSWAAIDRDPTDGSLWVASSESVELLRIGRDGRQSAVRIPNVVGRGGFSDLRVGGDGLYVVATGADHAVWRVDRTGKVLERAFPRPERVQEDPEAPLPGGVALLGRGRDGAVVLYLLSTGEIHRARDGEGWTAMPERFSAPGGDPRRRDLRVQGRGTASETWFFGSEARGIFFIGEDPVLLGSSTHAVERMGNSLRGLRGGREVFAIEDCAGREIIAIDADALGFAAVGMGFRGTVRSREDDAANWRALTAEGAVLLLGRWPAATPPAD